MLEIMLAFSLKISGVCFIPVSEGEHDGKTSQDLVFLLIFLSLLDFQLKRSATLAIVFLPFHFWFFISKNLLISINLLLIVGK